MKVKGLAMAVFALLLLMAGSVQVGNVVITGMLSPAWSQEKIIKIDGSSTVYPITEAVAEEFQKAKKGTVKVTVGISGTGGGFKKFSRGETDISDASRPITQKEIEACKEAGIQYIELPVAYDGLAVMVNPKNSWVTSMTVAQLKRIWEPAAEGKVTKWSYVNSAWPDVALKLYGPGVDSGTFDYFTEAIVGKSRASRGDFTASEDDNVLVQGVASDKGGLGFFGYAYYAENSDKLKLVAIDGGKGPVLPSEKTVMDGTYYPLSRPIFIYVNKKSAQRPEVKEFVDFYLKNAPTLVKQVKYIPLPDMAYKLAAERFSKRVTGTVFGGEAKVGVKIEDLLKLEKKK
ncbi:MAG: protein sphX [Deltaproteobacteria bacterium RBG_16_54_11]|jgi:phosphate transport system substrate-binding protein|nr:MAG: protein sphX [Deltaproteobacteria bacterium RBG_16_54_11]